MDKATRRAVAIGIAAIVAVLVLVLVVIPYFNDPDKDAPKCESTLDCGHLKECSDKNKCVSIKCSVDKPCPEGAICFDGRCTPFSLGCGPNTPCPAGQKCQKGVCVTSAEEGGCLSSADCGLGATCEDGKCTQIGQSMTMDAFAPNNDRVYPTLLQSIAPVLPARTVVPNFYSDSTETISPPSVQQPSDDDEFVWDYPIGPEVPSEPVTGGDLKDAPANQVTVSSTRQSMTGPAMMKEDGEIQQLNIFIGTTPISDSSMSYDGMTLRDQDDNVIVSFRVNGRVVKKSNVEPRQSFNGPSTRQDNPSHVRLVTVDCSNSPIRVKRGDKVDALIRSSNPIRAKVNRSSNLVQGSLRVYHPNGCF